MSLPTLYYLNGRGRAEVSRIILNYAGAKFNDHRIQTYPIPEDIRNLTTFGQFPNYIDADIQLSQSIAIETYLANKYNLNGSNQIDQVKILSYALSCGDLFQAYFTSKYAGEAGMTKFRSELAPRTIKCWEKIISENGGKHTYGNTLTWADISIFNALDYIYYMKEQSILEPFPACRQFHQQILELPQLSAYFKSRPTDDKF
ncbi:hypothetical protein PPL_09748 [Heterostelium album PN500]|uniref:Glutathione S-transferase n=1 Tax=Heterostelium pallidum (strain ATCC 26659 / Pp 5 / PN500) TaxID=670386 RepID=D3BNP5_HETP5|nr:hypothetical protein PPL_09748 [Heterostelium album PN500]EFA76996.1 hypothetical protein PPL_09748 [Heterostelium album PN500]|eukprot:XP_020429127.1 hypothetical protein PPL_09748 [Heterostelium album PN500]